MGLASRIPRSGTRTAKPEPIKPIRDERRRKRGEKLREAMAMAASVGIHGSRCRCNDCVRKRK